MDIAKNNSQILDVKLYEFIINNNNNNNNINNYNRYFVSRLNKKWRVKCRLNLIEKKNLLVRKNKKS